METAVNLQATAYGEGPIKTLLLVDPQNLNTISSWISEVISNFTRLEIVVSAEKGITAIEDLVKEQGRPFVVVIDLTQQNILIGGSGHRWKEILEESLSKSEMENATQLDDKLSLWYLSKYELSTLRLGKNRPALQEELKKIFSYLNGR